MKRRVLQILKVCGINIYIFFKCTKNANRNCHGITVTLIAVKMMLVVHKYMEVYGQVLLKTGRKKKKKGKRNS